MSGNEPPALLVTGDRDETVMPGNTDRLAKRLDGLTGGFCWPDCDAFTCAGACDADGSCVGAEGQDCDAQCSTACAGDIDAALPPASRARASVAAAARRVRRVVARARPTTERS